MLPVPTEICFGVEGVSAMQPLTHTALVICVSPGLNSIRVNIVGLGLLQGDHWPLKFVRSSDGDIVSVAIEGLGLWPGVLNKKAE